MNACVADVMTWISLTIRPTCPAATALQTLVAADAEELFVITDDDTFLGLVTDYSLLKAELNGALADATAEQLMHRRPITFTPETCLAEAAKAFRDAMISKAPVLRDGRLVGMIQRRDVLRWIAIHGSDRTHDESTIQAPKFLSASATTPLSNDTFATRH